MTTVSKTNIAEIPELVDIVVEHKVSNFGFARYCPNPEDFDLLVAPEEYRDFLDKMWEKYMQNQECDTRFALKDHLWKLYLYEKGLFNPEEVNNPDNLVLESAICTTDVHAQACITGRISRDRLYASASTSQVRSSEMKSPVRNAGLI